MLLYIYFWFRMSTDMTIFMVIACLSFATAQISESKDVTIVQGIVRGYKEPNSNVFDFYGIPYATAPTGMNKFKAPLAPPTWTNIFEATDSSIACYQNPGFAINLNMTEDCLVANVFVPDTQKTNLPVVLYIHGGVYILGSAQQLPPKRLAESGSVLAIAINYRLGAHGFLCLGTEDIPGNAGLKDMLAALHWIKNNIAAFGGNPDDVTIAGYSAGASAVDLLMISKSAEGLFNKVIPESGANVAAWSVQIDPMKTAQDYAQKLNFNNVGDLKALDDFYKTISYDLLLSDISALTSTNTDFVFTPCIEKDLGQEMILDDSPVNIIKKGKYKKVPVLYGFANMEGMLRLPYFDTWASQMNENLANFIPHDLQFQSDSEKQDVVKKIKEFYFGNNNVGLYTVFDYINFFSDVTFNYPALRSVKLQMEAGGNSIYLYEYTFYKKYPYVDGVPSVLINFPGADHCAQTEAVLTSPQDYETEEYRQMKEKMQELWINFIVTGNPVPEGSSFPAWPPTNANSSPYMILGDSIELGGPLNEQRTQFWNGIYEQYYRHPVAPTQPENAPGSANTLSRNIVLSLVLMCASTVISEF